MLLLYPLCLGTVLLAYVHAQVPGNIGCISLVLYRLPKLNSRCYSHRPISLLLPRLPKLPNQCYSNGPGNLTNLDSNE